MVAHRRQYLRNRTSRLLVHRASSARVAHRPEAAANYGLAVGRDADLVLLDTARVADAIIDLPVRKAVVKRGRVVARTRHAVELAF